MNNEEIQAYLTKGFEGIQAVQLAEIEKAKAEWAKKHDDLVASGADSAEVKASVDRAMKRLDRIEAEWSRPDAAQFHSKSLGEYLIESEAVKSLAQQSQAGGQGTVAGQRAIIRVKSFMEFPGFAPNYTDQKTTITSSAVGSSTPGILTPDRIVPGIVGPGIRRIRVRDLMPRLTTTQNAIEFVRENAFTNASSPVAETISKPESALTFVIASANVRTLAHWIPAARQVLDDFSALQGYVNQRLLDGLKDVEDYEIVAGDGTGQHLTGLSSTATAYDTARNVASDTRIDRLNHAISQVEDVNHSADGIILHPRDWRNIQLIKEETGGANTGAYLLGGPVGNAAPTLWGLPVATTTAVTAGTFYVGAFGLYCAVVDRMDARIDISTEHSDYFIRNMVAIRAEERLTFFQTRTDAVIYGSF